MDLNRLFHNAKTFAELNDQDVERFLQERTFGREHLNLEFKREFPTRSNGKYDIKEICKYIAGYSNEEGGVVVYGVDDSIKEPAKAFPDYISGLAQSPSVEDLSQWVTERVVPLVQSPAIRTFKVAGKVVMVLKIPEGINRPYAYVEPPSNALTFFKKTAGGLKELKSDEVKELYWSAIIHQADRIVRAGIFRGMDIELPVADQFAKHRERVTKQLEDTKGYGRLSIYCVPDERIHVPVSELKKFLEDNRGRFSEVLRYFPNVETFQSGVTVGYFPRAIRQDIKSTARVTLTEDGLAAWDSQVDMTMDRDGVFHPYWLSYEVQRQLQLAKVLLEPRGVKYIRVYVELEHIERFKMKMFGDFFLDQPEGPYSGSHDRIERRVALTDIHDPFGPQRNIVFPAAREIVDEISRIFGFDKAPDRLWEADGKMVYVRNLEATR